MRLHRLQNFFITALVLMCPAQQVQAQIEQDIPEDQYHVAAIMNLIEPELSFTALSVWDLADSRSVFQQNSNVLMNPASIQKLLTALVSAKQLGRSFQYKTEIFSDQTLNITNGVLNNNLYVSFSGDPTLKQRHLIALINQLKKIGIHTVNGDIHLIGHHQDQLQAPGWVWDDLGICYAAPVSSFIIDKNCVFARLSANGYNKKAALKVMGNRPIYVENEAIFIPYQTDSLACDLQLIRKDSNHFTLKGCYAGAKSLPLAIAINEPQGYAVNVVKAIFVKQKIALTGKMTVEVARPITQGNLYPIATHLSEPLPLLIDEMLLQSDNLMAEALLRTSAEYYQQQPLNFKQTTQSLVLMLRELGIELEMANIADGSGLSRYNLLSAEHVMAVLKVIANHQDYQYLLESLPVAGIKGTLQYKRYFNKPPLKYKVMAKTGSMLGVSNLAGQFEASNGKRYLFVLIENGLSPKIKKTQKAPFSAILLQNLMDMPLVHDPKVNSPTDPSVQ